MKNLITKAVLKMNGKIYFKISKYLIFILFLSMALLYKPFYVECKTARHYDSILESNFDIEKISVLNLKNKIEDIKVSDYLKTAVISESPDADYELYKAMAVLIRTLVYSEFLKKNNYDCSYLKNNVNPIFASGPRHRRDGKFLLCSKTHCVSFKNCADSEKLKLSQNAVNETKDEILVFDNIPVEIFFSANCGGFSHTPAELYDSELSYPYYQKSGVNDCPCQSVECRKWETVVSKKFLEKIIGRGTVIELIEIFQNPYQIIINGKISLCYDRLMHYVERSNYRRIKSPNFMITIDRNAYALIFKGAGVCNGIGLCQKGAEIYSKK